MERLRHSKDFLAVRNYGKSWRNDLLVLSVLRNGQAESRAGFIVSKKLGKAVQRNKVKRRLRAALYGWTPRLAGGYDLVIIARQKAATAPYQVLDRELGHLFERSQLIVDEADLS